MKTKNRVKKSRSQGVEKSSSAKLKSQEVEIQQVRQTSTWGQERLLTARLLDSLTSRLSAETNRECP